MKINTDISRCTEAENKGFHALSLKGLLSRSLLCVGRVRLIVYLFIQVIFVKPPMCQDFFIN